MRLKLLLALTFFAIASLYSQSLYRMNNVPIYKGSKKLLNPFTGGMNSCIIGQMDMNNDGKKDLMVLHQVGSTINRIQTYIQSSNGNYVYTPRYEAFFPKEYNYPFVLADLNEDKLEDLVIMTSIYYIVYYAQRNNDSSFQFNFYDTLEFNRYSDTFTDQVNPINKYLPVFRDMDGDGDVDIIATTRNKDGYGNERIWLKNYKKEFNLPNNQNKWMLDNKHYGLFAFNFAPLVFLNGVYQAMEKGIQKPNIDLTPRHNEYQMIWDLDVNGDGLYDVVGYSENERNAPLGVNIGTKDSAYIIHSDTFFPSYSKPIRTLMPNGFWYDINHDNKNDILTSFLLERDNSGVLLQDKAFNDDINTISYYKNVGKRNVFDAKSLSYHDSFVFITDSFLANETIDVGTGSAPVFFNYDNDSLIDLLIPNLLKRDSFEKASITYYKNIGSKQQPQYQFVTNDLFNYSAKNRANIKIAVGDLNGDKIDDLLITSYSAIDYAPFNSYVNAKINYEVLYQKSVNGNILFLTDTLAINFDEKYGRSNICIADIDKDGKNDLLLGDVYNLKYYKNIGTASSPMFSSPTCDSVINVMDLSSFIYNHFFYPAVWTDPSDKKDYLLFAYDYYGGKVGKALIDTQKLNNNRSLNIDSKNLYDNYSINVYPTIFLKDVTNDSIPEVIFGNYGGGVQMFSLDSLTGVKDPPAPNPTNSILGHSEIENIQVYPNPVTNQLNILIPKLQKSASMYIYSYDGRMIQHQELTSSETIIEVSRLSKGIYWMLISNKNHETEYLKFVKE